MDFLLVIIEHFSLSDKSLAIRDRSIESCRFLKGAGQFGPKFEVEQDVSQHPFVHG